MSSRAQWLHVTATVVWKGAVIVGPHLVLSGNSWLISKSQRNIVRRRPFSSLLSSYIATFPGTSGIFRALLSHLS